MPSKVQNFLLKRHVEAALQMRRMAKTDPTGMVRACNELLLQISRSNGNAQVKKEWLLTQAGPGVKCSLNGIHDKI